jgi:hypothetical protein
VFQETELKIKALGLGCDLITCGFAPRKYTGHHYTSRIFTIEATGAVCQHNNFATIGSGNVIAESVLYQRTLTRFAPLERTLYVVYEAMKSSKIAPGVGSQINIVVIEPSADDEFVMTRILSRDGFQHQDEIFKKYAPKKLDVLPAINGNWFDQTPTT